MFVPTYMFIKFRKFFLPTRLFQPTCLLNFEIFPSYMFIPPYTFIRNSRVILLDISMLQKFHQGKKDLQKEILQNYWPCQD